MVFGDLFCGCILGTLFCILFSSVVMCHVVFCSLSFTLSIPSKFSTGSGGIRSKRLSLLFICMKMAFKCQKPCISCGQKWLCWYLNKMVLRNCLFFHAYPLMLQVTLNMAFYCWNYQWWYLIQMVKKDKYVKVYI